MQLSPALLDCPSAFLSNKGSMLLEQGTLFGEQFDPFLSFQINNLLIFQSFCLKYSYYIFPKSFLDLKEKT